jgi:hypothetical protein
MKPDDLADIVAAVMREALAPLETRLAVLEATRPTEALVECTKTIGTLRERVAVVEAREPVPGPAGPPGKDGADGLGIDDVAVEHDGARGVTFKFMNGDRTKTIDTITLPFPIGRGIYTPGGTYATHDIVTHDGGWWECLKATSARPGTADGAGFWRLVVKSGDRKRGS